MLFTFEYLLPPANFSNLTQLDTCDFGGFPLLRSSLFYYICQMGPSSLCQDLAQLLQLQRRGRSQVKPGVPRNIPPANSTPTNSNDATATIAAVLTGSLLILVALFWYMWMIGCFGHRIKINDTEDQLKQPSTDCIHTPMSREAWQSTLKKKDSSVPQYVLEQDSCAICLEPVQDQDDIRPLPCNHFFHAQCFDRWFWQAEQTNRCPLCRTIFPDPPGCPKKPVELHLRPQRYERRTTL